jgi:acetylornithine deacetylase/succinyl-diaminopimelate desuccinylase-like protein
MDIYAKVRRHLDKHDFSDIEMTPAAFASEPSLPPIDSDVVKAIQRASLEFYQKEAVMKVRGTGGTPSWMVTNYLHIPIAGTGLGTAIARAHGHNEHVVISEFLDCTKFMATILYDF